MFKHITGPILHKYYAGLDYFFQKMFYPVLKVFLIHVLSQNVFLSAPLVEKQYAIEEYL